MKKMNFSPQFLATLQRRGTLITCIFTFATEEAVQELVAEALCLLPIDVQQIFIEHHDFKKPLTEQNKKNLITLKNVSKKESALKQYNQHLKSLQNNVVGVIADRWQSIPLKNKISRYQAMQMSVEHSGLHKTIVNALVRYGLVTMQQVFDLSDDELLTIPFFTQESLDEFVLWRQWFGV